MATRSVRLFLLVVLSWAALLAGGCAAARTTGKVVLTPVTVVRDVVDAPLVSVTNVFQFWADKTNPNPVPGAGVGWNLKGGFNAGLGLDVSHWLFQGVSWVIGGVDYVVCRSIWPNFAAGVSPWKKQGESWGSLYFPNTRALWRGEDDDELAPEEEWSPPPEPKNPDYPYDAPS